jgi:hypothetical protein
MGDMSNDDRLNELLARALAELDPPPATPREEMWTRIQAERASSSPDDAGRDVIALRPRTRRTTWIPWSAAAAAVLVVGIGLGRMSMQTQDPSGMPTASSVPAEEAGATVPPAYRLAATNHLERTETLLASLAVDNGPGGTQAMSSWAGELLTDTRLLLSSPAAEDAATRKLLEDLELVLAQIAGIPESRAQQEVELIHAGLNQSDVLLRLRAATAGPRLVGT